MNTITTPRIVGILSPFILLVALAGFLLSLQAFYWEREIGVPTVLALAPANSQKIAQVILTNVHPPGNGEFVRTMVESEQWHAALLHKGWLAQVNASQKRSLVNAAMWFAVLVASTLAVGMLFPRRTAPHECRPPPSGSA